MKQLLIAAVSLAGLFVPALSAAQAYNCYLVCSPPRVYCVPAGAPLPPIQKICGVGSETPDPGTSFSSSLGSLAPAQTAPACAAQQVFDENTQTYEWQMVCD